jgi:hypothetical protein
MTGRQTPRSPWPLAAVLLIAPPLSGHAAEARPQSWVQMRLSLSNPTPDVGEEVQLYIDLLIRRAQVNHSGKPYAYLPVSKVTLKLPPLDGVRQVELERSLERLVEENAIEPGKHGFRVNNLPTEVKMEHEPADGRGPDLDPGRYRRRLAIPLRVREGGTVTLAAAHAAGEVFAPAGGNKGKWEPFVATSEPLTFTALDLRRRADRPSTNATPDAPTAPLPPTSVQEEPGREFRAEWLLPWAEGVMALAALACVVVGVARRLRGARPVAVSVEPARPAAVPRLKPLPPPPTFAGVRQTLQDFLRRHFRLPPGEVTPHDAGESLRRGDVSEWLARSITALLETCETAEFAPGVVSTAPSELAAYARQLMDQILAALPEVVAARS